MSGLERNLNSVATFDGKDSSWLVFKTKFMGCLLVMGAESVIEYAEKQYHTEAAVIQSMDMKGQEKSAQQENAARKDEKSLPIGSSNSVPSVELIRKVYGLLMCALNGEALQMVTHIKSGDAIAVWEILLRRYERNTVASKLHLRRMLHGCRMNDMEIFDSYLSRINQLCQRLMQMGSDVNVEEKLYVLLDGLPESYESLRQSLEINSTNFNEACQHIRDYQEKKTQQTTKEEEIHMSLFAGTGTGHSRNGGGHGGRSQNNNNSRGSNGGGGSDSNRCWTCKEIGHIAYYCLRNRNVVKCTNCKGIGHEERNCRRSVRSGNHHYGGGDEEEISGLCTEGRFGSSGGYVKDEWFDAVI